MVLFKVATSARFHFIRSALKVGSINYYKNSIEQYMGGIIMTSVMWPDSSMNFSIVISPQKTWLPKKLPLVAYCPPDAWSFLQCRKFTLCMVEMVE